MEYLYAPWRNEYTADLQKNGCVFCSISVNSDKDEENTVLYRDEICFVVMNKSSLATLLFFIALPTASSLP